jgi:hypothetical protein
MSIKGFKASGMISKILWQGSHLTLKSSRISYLVQIQGQFRMIPTHFNGSRMIFVTLGTDEFSSFLKISYKETLGRNF